MPTRADISSCLHPPASWSPPLSPASSSSIEYVSKLAVASRTNEQTSRYPTQIRAEGLRPFRQQDTMEDHSFRSQRINPLNGLGKGVYLLKGQSDERNGEPVIMTQSPDEKCAWPVLVAVRCRPRKRQRSERRFGAEPSTSAYNSSSSSGDEGSDHRSSSSRIQRGVFEYSACRDYDNAATYHTELPLPSMQRPRRLYVQAPSHTTRSTSGRRSFDFDYLFPPWQKQRDVYDKCAHAQIRHVLESHQQGQQQHTTLVAYGQTGTGKTYTMGMLSDFTDDSERGMIPRALSQILEFAANSKGEESSEIVITLSFLQIYLETIQDLFALPGSAYLTSRKPWKRKHDKHRSFNVSSSDLPVRQGRDGAFYVTGLNEYEISSIDDAHALLELAMRNRVLAATAKNKTSSRSHTLLTISVQHRRCGIRSRDSAGKDENEEYEEEESDFVDEEDESTQASTISFVDLAGSERVDGALHFLRATRARQEQRIREAKFINRSLSALGGVIAALAQPKVGTGSTSAEALARLKSTSRGTKAQAPVGNEPHIRFRDSQLTKLLQGRLMGGRGRLLLIATVNDQPKDLSETLSTLKFATQCRRVELQPGSRLRGDRNSRLRRQNSFLDQAFKDMKTMHEHREAALHSEYQARIQVLEGELEAVRAAAQVSSFTSVDDVAPIHLASYTALCSLVDTVRSAGVDQPREITKHPRIADFQSEKEMLENVAGLYSQLKESIIARHKQDHRIPRRTAPETSAKLPRPKHDQIRQPGILEDHEDKQSLHLDTDKQTAFRKPLPAKPELIINDAKLKRTRSSIHLSPEQEAEFRAIARHLISTHALASVVVSSSDEDEHTAT